MKIKIMGPERVCCLLSLKLLLLQLHYTQVLSQVELKYALFTTGPAGRVASSGVVPAIELAEEMVNHNTSVLTNYTLTHTGVVDTMCDRTRSLNLFFNSISPSNPTILGLLGCGCSVASAPVAENIHHSSISQISYFSTFAELGNRARFPNFFRTIPSDAGFSPAIISVLKFYGWQRIAFITQRTSLFMEAYNLYNRDFRKTNITTKNRMLNARNITRSLKMTNLFFEEEDYRIFFLNVYSSFARQVLCEAYKRGLSYPRYVWLTYGWYQDKWWTKEVNPQPIDCSDEQLAGFIERGIAVQLLPEAPDPDMMTDTGLTPNQFYDLYSRRLRTRDSQRNNYSYTHGATIAYDALWTLALALNRASQMIASNIRDDLVAMTGCNETSRGAEGDLVSLEDFMYTNELMGCVIRWCIEQTDFIGVSGRVRFNKEGTRRHPNVRIVQYRTQMIEGDITKNSLHFELFAMTSTTKNSTSSFSYINNESNSSVYPDALGGVPPDGSPYARSRTFYLELVVVFYTLAAVGLVCSTVCLIFNYTQRNKKVVRLTSPGLNYFIIAGGYIICVAIIIRVIPSMEYEVNAARCKITIFFTNLGYCLTFGTILAKMGRIYYIFRNPTTSKKALKDWHLVLVILAVTGIGCLMGVLHLTVPQLRLDAFLREDLGYGVGRDELGVQIKYMTYQCSPVEGSYGGTWLLLTFIYFGLLQVIGIILAIQTRKVQIKVLNDSKYVAALIYISSIMLLLLPIITYLFNAYLNVAAILFSGGFSFAIAAFLCLIFIPKMVSLYRDPKGEKIFDRASRVTSMAEGTLTGAKSRHVVNHSSDDCTQSDAITITQLQLRVGELERLLRDNQMSGSIEQSVEGSPAQLQDSTSTSTVTLLFDPPSADRETETQDQADTGSAESNEGMTDVCPC